MSPRAIDKRARPGNDATPAPTGPPAPLGSGDFGSTEPLETEDTAVIDGAED